MTRRSLNTCPECPVSERVVLFTVLLADSLGYICQLYPIAPLLIHQTFCSFLSYSSTLTMAKLKPLTEYPPDIIEIITSFLTFDDFRNFRLVNGMVHDAKVSLFVRRFFRPITLELTLDGLQKLLEICNPSDNTGEARFGGMLRCLSITQGVWSGKKESRGGSDT
jgi:hypothetical protein